MSKICSKCNSEKIYCEYYKKKGTKDGYNTTCIKCELEQKKLKSIKMSKREVPTNIHDGTKKCPQCGLTKEKTMFSKDITRIDFLNKWCKGCSTKANKKYYDSQCERQTPANTFIGTKICSNCDKELDKKNFHSKKDTPDFLNPWCKQCRKEEQYNELRLHIRNKKIQMGGKCAKCENDDINVLQFDHYVGNKCGTITHLQSKRTIDNEIQKCQLLCIFCHHIKTAKDNKHKEFTGKNMTNRMLKVKRNYDHVDGIKLKIGSCKMCCRKINENIKEELCAYHFDHIDEKNKSANISFLCKQGYSISTIDEEINKCQLLCANCHMLRTIKQFNYYNYSKLNNKTNYIDMSYINIGLKIEDTNKSYLEITGNHSNINVDTIKNSEKYYNELIYNMNIQKLNKKNKFNNIIVTDD